MNIQYVISHSLHLFYCRRLRFGLCRKSFLLLRILLSCRGSDATLWRSFVKHHYALVSKVISRVISHLSEYLVRIELVGFLKFEFTCINLKDWTHKDAPTIWTINLYYYYSYYKSLTFYTKTAASMSAQSGGSCLDLSSLLLGRPWL